MRFILSIFALVLAACTTPAFAGFQAYNGTSDLKLFEKLKCSTGLTCTRVGDKLSIVSSPTISTGSLGITGADAGDATLTMAADRSDDSGDDWVLKSVASDNTFTISNDVSGSQVAKMTFDTGGGVTGPGTGALSGYLQKQVAATATTITAAQCGSTFYNSGAVVINLPNGAAGLIGCRLTFITLNASNFDVNPGNSDQIILLTDAAGDAIRNATIGNVVTLQYAATNKWIDIAHIGTWSDIN
jgi:hypothetical protein